MAERIFYTIYITLCKVARQLATFFIMNIKNQCLYPVKAKMPVSFFRCGKCPPCLRQRANEMAVRVYRESQSYPVTFMTLTYRDDVCPIYNQNMYIDVDTGEIIKEEFDIVRGTNFFVDAPFEWKMNKKCHPTKRYHPLISDYFEMLDVDGEIRHVYRVESQYFTSYIDDVQRWLKRFRKNHSDEIPGTFRYTIVPEMGGCGFRPHYHCIFVNLPKSLVHSLAIDWQDRYGIVDIDILCESPDPSASARKVGMYVGKYCSKGEFDCPYIGSYCNKCHRCSSIDFGCGDGEAYQKLVDYLLVFEVFGVHNPNQFEVSSLSKKEIRLLASRRTYKIDGYNYPMPKYLLKKIMYNQYKYEKLQLRKDSTKTEVVFGYRATPIQKAVSDFVLDKFISDVVRKQEESKRSWDFDSQNFGYKWSSSMDENIRKASALSSYRSEIERGSIF